MPGKRKASEVPPSTYVSTKRPRSVLPSKKLVWVWKKSEWVSKKKLHQNIELMNHKDTKQLIVKKVLKHSENSSGQKRHFEIRSLEMLPPCDRIVSLLGYANNFPDDSHSAAFFDYFPLGDVHHWKDVDFDQKNFKAVPESYIWRFFVQMALAIAFIHKQLGPLGEHRDVIIHRDIKPKNVLVVNNGSTYPSFKLHDFGCGTIWSLQKAQQPSLCGTFEWQAPENPKINTTAADIWALGACIHYLALGKAPIQSATQFQREVRAANHGLHPKEASQYSPVDRYYAAKVKREVTPINLSQPEQRDRGLAPYRAGDRALFNAEYSDELNKWMMRTLHMNPNSRPSASNLVDLMIPEAREMLRKSSKQSGLIDLEVHFKG